MTTTNFNVAAYAPLATAPYDAREAMIDYFEAQVMGPIGGDAESLGEPPTGRYLVGILYPREADTAGVMNTEEDDGAGATGGEEPSDDPLTMANAYLPASIGLTFFMVHGAAITCEVRAARYAASVEDRKKSWRRQSCAGAEGTESVILTPDPHTMRARESVFGGLGELRALWRPLRDGFLVSVSLLNAQRQTDPDDGAPVDKCLFQVGMTCAPTQGTILEYPTVDFLSRDPEDEELRLLYRDAPVFAIGHGCAADWDMDDETDDATRDKARDKAREKRVRRVRTEVLPRFTVPAVKQAGNVRPDVLRLSWLSDPTVSAGDLVTALGSLVDAYTAWIVDLPSDERHQAIPPSLRPARDRVLGRLQETVSRMARGVEFLGRDADAREAFRLANLAMLMQMYHVSKAIAGTRRSRAQAPPAMPSSSLAYLGEKHSWYPFQLAFALLTLPSVARSDVPERELVDLLWFPTGGGKTEAYLLLTAFVVFYRRLTLGDRGAGTTVITRYTLRLLTAQQFQRAATLACAAELIRRDHESRMGAARISIGLWVGREVSPNTFDQAAELLAEVLEEAEPVNKFQLEQCPWCGTEIMPARREEDRAAYGVRVDNDAVVVHCPSARCVFHQWLPVSMVDQDLYLRPPTVLLATVDKFAQLAWSDGGRAFFGTDQFAPPSLIIQDEMHLLSGPLGTTVGVYEAAVEGLIEKAGARPKIIASTATIRRANDQVAGLFGRSVALFPPPGLAAGESFFAEVDPDAPGRRYVGLMSQGHTPHTTVVHAASALLQAPVELGLDGAARDAFWTLVAYHNSLRELGRTATLARDDIPARIPNIATDQARARVIEDHLVEELQGSVNAKELPAKLFRLGLDANHEEAVAVLATTNMLSVGVDIPRLGLMLVIGQPKTTAEYIQASSRVGRSRHGPGGLVVAMYVSTKPRDRSHYESFRPYHASLYKHVEPTSVTPYSLPSRERALHAALVVLVRHGIEGMAPNDAAGRFRRDLPGVPDAVRYLLDRVARIDPDEVTATRRQLESLVDAWEALAREAAAARKPLYYDTSTRQHLSLLRRYGEKGRGWETLGSMRNVDRQCGVAVLGEN